MAGIDMAWRVRQELHLFSEPGMKKPLIQDKLYEMGRFGQKTGKGWFSYGADRKPVPDPEVLNLVRTMTREARIEQREFSNKGIVERSLYGLINEGARILEEGYAFRAADIDVIYVNGYGFPAWRGGPMFYSGAVGLKRIYERICDYQKRVGREIEASSLVAAARRGRQEFSRL